jgi:hypothetical protein
MSEPAKDKAELVERVARELCCGDAMCKSKRRPGVSEGRDAIDSIRSAGWAVVPQEPNFNMESEGSVAMVKLGYLPSPGEVAEIYRAMLAAAPGAKP